LFDFLQANGHARAPELQALLVEQKKTNRLLSAILYGGVGFVLGLVVMQVVLRVHLF